MVGRQAVGAREIAARPRRSAAGRGRRRRGPSSLSVPPACSERLHQPSASGGAATVAITRGACCSSSGSKRRKSAGAKLMLAPWSRSARSTGPKKPGEVVDVRVLERLRPGEQQRAVDPQVGPVVALAERRHERRRLPGAERDAERVAAAGAARRPPAGSRLRHPAATYPPSAITATAGVVEVSLGEPGVEDVAAVVLRAQAREDDLEVALPGERRRPGRARGRRGRCRRSGPGRPRARCRRAACPRPWRGRSSPRRVDQADRLGRAAADLAALVHRLGEQPVLGHHLGRVGHELDEALPAVLGLECLARPARPGPRSAPGRGPRAGRPWSGSGGRRCRLRRRRRARCRRSGRRGRARRTARAPTRGRSPGCGARRRAGDGRGRSGRRSHRRGRRVMLRTWNANGTKVPLSYTPKRNSRLRL